MVKTILCFGDSNTWGYDPATQSRLSINERWAGVLRNELGSEYWVIEEGLNGRTTVFDDPLGDYKNGKEYIIPCIQTHAPIDLVVIMLGTNDLKKRFSLPAIDIARGAEVLVNLVKNSQAGPDGQTPQILLLAPPPVHEVASNAEGFEGAAEKSKKFGDYYGNVAKQTECHFLNTADVIQSSKIDGIHFEVQEHEKLGKKVAEFVRGIF